MKYKVLAVIVLVVGSLPMAMTYTAPAQTPASSDDGSAVGVQQLTAGTATDTENPSGTTTEYTKLYIDTENNHPELNPGDSDTFTITVQNGEDAAVTVDPHAYVPPVGENRIKASWVTIDGDTTIDAGETAEFTVTVSVPEDVTSGYHRGQIAFTNETVTYPGRPARPLHAASINVRVWREPTVDIVSGTYLRGQIEVGSSVTKQIVIKNAGDEAVPVNPQFISEPNHCRGDCPSSVDPAWVDIDAPNQIAPGETKTVTVTVSPPTSADRGRYDGTIDLGLKDPARDDRNNYWQEVRMNFEVWSQPDDPLERSFQVSDRTDEVTLTLSPRSYPHGSADERSSFDVVFVSPDGTTIPAKRVQLSERGFVDLSSSHDDTAVQQGDYAIRSGTRQFVYRVDDPAAGTWRVKIMPSNTIGFSYDLVRNESDE